MSGSSNRLRSCVSGSMRTTPPRKSCGSAITGRERAGRRWTGRPQLMKRSASAGSMASGNGLTTTATSRGSRHAGRDRPGARSMSPRSLPSTAEGRMRPAGLAAFAARTEANTASTRTSGLWRTSAMRNWRVSSERDRMGRLAGPTAVVPSPGHELGDQRQAAGDARTPSLDADREIPLLVGRSNRCAGRGTIDECRAESTVRPPASPAATPAPAAFHLGAGHLIVHGNPAFLAAFGPDAIGQPAARR